MSVDAETLLLLALLPAAALLYASVGHGGASGYLAAMAVAGVAPATMKPTALALNIVVAAIATVTFHRAGALSWRLILPLVAVAAPCAYAGGRLTLPPSCYKPLVGVVLLYAAWRSFATAKAAAAPVLRKPSTPALLLLGAGLGFLSGLTGVGGGIFLSPLLLFLCWAPPRTVSGVSAAFILVNSVAGILGVLSTGTTLHRATPLFAAVVALGGYVGATYGSTRLGNPAIQRLLAVVLLVAGLKMIATA